MASHVTKIYSIKFFSEDPNYADFWNSIGLEGQKKLEGVIKDKVKFENEFIKKFFERYIHERDYHGLINTNFLFGHYNLISRVFYLMFFALRKEGKIIKDFIVHLLEQREISFLETILANEGTGNFQVSLDPYKIEIQNVVDNTNYDFMTRYIPNYIMDKYYHKYFKTESITFVGNDMKKQVLIKNNLYDFNSSYNFITVYSETENTAYIYLAPEITIADFNNIGITRYLLWKNLKLKNVKFFTIPTQEEFYEFRSYITVFQEVQFKILHSVQTESFKRWLISGLVDKRMGDFSCYVYKGGTTQYSRVETEFNNNGYRTILNEGIFFDKIKRDLQRLGVQLEGLTTLRNFNVGKVTYRISIINNDMSFQVSIRRTNNDYYKMEDITANGFSTELLLTEQDLSCDDYKAKYYKKLKDFGESGTQIVFTLSNFVNETDADDMRALMYETTGFSYCIGETGSGKTTLLKVYFSEFYRHFLEKKIVKKMITLEAPIEEVDFNFYQIAYDLNNPEELREIVKATKTSKPDIVIMSETKDVATMNMIYEEAQLHHSVSTIHKADVYGFMNALVGYAIELEYAGTDMLSKINFAIAQNKMKIVDTDSIEKNGLKLVYRNQEAVEKFLYGTFGMDFSDEINLILDTRQIRIINNQSQDDTVWKINNDQYQRTYILYERLFKREVTQFLNNEFEEGTFISNEILLNRIRNIYRYIGMRNRMVYKLILLYLTGKIIGVNEGKIFLAAETVNGLSKAEKKEFLEALLEDLPARLRTTSGGKNK